MIQPERLEWVFSVQVPLLVVADGRVVQANGAACALLTPGAEPALPASLADLFGAPAAERIAALFAPAGCTRRDIVVPHTAGGETRALGLTLTGLPPPARGHLITIADHGPPPAGSDAGPAAAWAARQPDLLSLLPRICDLLPIGLHIEDASEHSLFVNENFVRTFGYGLEEIERPDQWWPLVYPDPDYRAQVKAAWAEAVALAARNDTEIEPQEWTVTCRNGERKVIRFHSRRMGDYNIHAYIDVTARHRLEAELRAQANTDALTGATSRRHFFAAAAEALSGPRGLCVLLFDLDHFKQVNDSHGHAVGDRVLRVVSARCRQVLRHDAELGRLGGEEFAVLLPDVSVMEARVVAERLRATVAHAPVESAGGALSVTISVGGAVRHESDAGIDDLIARADRALYAAKRSGRNRVVFGDGPAAGRGD